jgi:HD-GYP domain-containing protein (c-di-GMP phosphodiesterase class II)
MGLAVVAIAAPLALFAPTGRSPAWWVAPALVLVYAIASRVEFEVGSGVALPTAVVLVPMLFLLPAREVPAAVAIAVLLGAAPSFARGRLSPERAVVLVGSSFFSLGPTLVFLVFSEPEAGRGGAAILVLALAAQLVADFGSAAVGEWCALRVPVRELVRPVAWAIAIDALLAPIGLVVAVAARTDALAILLPLPLFALLALFARERRRRLDHVLELSSAYRGTAFLLGDVVKADDEYTGDHSREVVVLALGVGDRLGLDARTRRDHEFTALLHDVGKIKIPAEIINKPGRLTPEERAIIDTHTLEGERLLRRVGGLLADIGGLVRSCHEHYDGRGYPDRLAREDIPLIARIVSCCDAYHAITSDRPYRRARTSAEAVDELLAHRGTQFDPAVVDALVAVVRERRPRLHRTASADTELLTCKECGGETLLATPTSEGHGVCLRCGLVPVYVAA